VGLLCHLLKRTAREDTGLALGAALLLLLLLPLLMMMLLQLPFPLDMHFLVIAIVDL